MEVVSVDKFWEIIRVIGYILTFNICHSATTFLKLQKVCNFTQFITIYVTKNAENQKDTFA